MSWGKQPLSVLDILLDDADEASSWAMRSILEHVPSETLDGLYDLIFKKKFPCTWVGPHTPRTGESQTERVWGNRRTT